MRGALWFAVHGSWRHGIYQRPVLEIALSLTSQLQVDLWHLDVSLLADEEAMNALASLLEDSLPELLSNPLLHAGRAYRGHARTASSCSVLWPRDAADSLVYLSSSHVLWPFARRLVPYCGSAAPGFGTCVGPQGCCAAYEFLPLELPRTCWGLAS